MSLMYGETGNGIAINALFIQPTYACAKNCKGCYVKLHQKKSETETDVENLTELIRRVTAGEGITANQITLSCDSMGHNELANQYMMRVYNSFGRNAEWKNGSNKDIELHVTVNSVHDLAKYSKNRLYPFDCISFSKLGHNLKSDIDDIKNYHSVKKINWNLQRPMYNHVICEKDWMCEIERVHDFVDSIYLLHTKRPIDTNDDLEQLVKDKENLRKDLHWMGLVKQRLAGSPKLMIDGCINDAMEYKKSLHGCSASVSRFQVWPDGSVSGCAYAKTSSTGPATTVEGIIANIRSAKRRYDFKSCYIPGALPNVLR